MVKWERERKGGEGEGCRHGQREGDRLPRSLLRACDVRIPMKIIHKLHTAPFRLAFLEGKLEAAWHRGATVIWKQKT